jgi:hypothetical protein
MSEAPDLYMRGYDVREESDLARVRACWKVREVRYLNPYAHLLLRCSPPISGKPYAFDDKDIELVVVAPRHAGFSVSSPGPFPLHVYVLRILPGVEVDKERFVKGDLDLFMWGLLYRSLQDAIEWKL